MLRLSKYQFRITHDNGKFVLNVIATSKKSALEMVLKAENCPKSAVELINKFAFPIPQIDHKRKA